MTTSEPSRNGTIGPHGVVDARDVTRGASRTWVLPLVIGLWLVTAVAAAAWHYGPGQRYSAKSTAAEIEQRAKAAAERGDWNEAVKQYTAALAQLPPEEIAERRRLTLSHATSRIQIGELAEAQEEIQGLMDELEGATDPTSAELLKTARHESGTASYFAGWLMRLEGAAPDEWRIETEHSRQQFHLLAEQATADGASLESTAFQRNLEAAIKLEQMDESTLVGRPLPKKCPNCCKNLSQRKRKQSESRCESDKKNQDQKKKPEDDARKQVKEDRKAGLTSGEQKGS